MLINQFIHHRNDFPKRKKMEGNGQTKNHIDSDHILVCCKRWSLEKKIPILAKIKWKLMTTKKGGNNSTEYTVFMLNYSIVYLCGTL